MIMPTMKKKTQRKSSSSREFPSPAKTMEIPRIDSVVIVSETGVDFTVGVGLSVLC
jgi:uncharacterized linocin/CFP29 family protein